MTNFQVIQIAAMAVFREMNSNDWTYFGDAEVGTLIAEVTRQGETYMVLQTPSGQFEIAGCTPDGEAFSYELQVNAL